MMIPRRQFLASSGAALVLPSAFGQNRAMSARGRFLGVTVMPEYIQSEGIDGILRSLERMGATAVTTSPYVIEEADEHTGSREPPADAGAGNVRLLDRPLFGKREIYMRTAPSFSPERRLYRGLRYQPPAPADLTREAGQVVGDFIRQAKAAGYQVYLQFQAAIPPGYRVQFGGAEDDDLPRLPDGTVPPRRVDKNGSLASPHIRNYTQALIRDLLRVYPDIDGIRPDWPEHPPYLLDSAFLDFSAHAQAAARRLRMSWELILTDSLAAWRYLHGSLTNEDLQQVLEGDGGRYGLLTNWIARPGIAQWLHLKRTIAEELLAGFAETLRHAGGADKQLMPNAFPPPFTAVSGFDFGRAARLSSAISVKLYTMHWPMMLRFYADRLLEANPGLSARLLAEVLVRLMDIDEQARGLVRDYRYPEPDEPHPVSAAAQERKIRQAQREAGDTPVIALAHGYGPDDDFASRLRSAWHASSGRVWVNRYGYLSDRKLDLIRQTCKP
jgi:hypothetical protein